MQAGPTPGQRTQLQRRSMLLGRDPVCDLVIDDVEISRRHARLITQSGGYAVEDLGSMNGTFVNDERITTVVTLKSGDRIRFGDQATFVYEAMAADEAEISAFTVEKAAPAPAAARPASLPPSPAVVAPVPPVEPLPASEPEVSDSPLRRRQRRKGLRLPLFTQPWMMIVAVVALLGACALIFLFWYIDANFLWCDVFGGLISACQ